MSQVGGSQLESVSKVTSGSVISNSVGSVDCYGIRATISFPFPPCCSLLCVEAILMVLSISSSLETSCFRFARFLVWTIFQLSVYYKLKFFDQTVFQYDPSHTTLGGQIMIIYYCVGVSMSIKTQAINNIRQPNRVAVKQVVVSLDLQRNKLCGKFIYI